MNWLVEYLEVYTKISQMYVHLNSSQDPAMVLKKKGPGRKYRFATEL